MYEIGVAFAWAAPAIIVLGGIGKILTPAPTKRSSR